MLGPRLWTSFGLNYSLEVQDMEFVFKIYLKKLIELWKPKMMVNTTRTHSWHIHVRDVEATCM